MFQINTIKFAIHLEYKPRVSFFLVFRFVLAACLIFPNEYSRPVIERKKSVGLRFPKIEQILDK